MVVDRGGLRYPIEVVDRFQATLAAFKKGVRESRQEMAGFRRTIRRLGTDSENISKAARATLELARNTRNLTAARATADKTSAAALNARQLSEKKILAIQKARVQLLITRQRLVAQEQVTARQSLALEVALRKEAERRALAVRRAVQAQAKAALAALATGKKGLAVSKKRNKELRRTNTLANRALFTFRRLFGVLAAFTIARAGIRGFGQLIKLGVDFNNLIALTRLGFAGIILSAGELRNKQGEILQGQQGFNAALRISARIQDQLRLRALETTATFGELSVAFQQAIAPGLEAGLGIDQILDLTVGLSQAATAIGLEQNKLAEEVRSILAGTARAQTTRIAALLGGATAVNKLRREAKDADDFFDKLIKRLQGVRTAAALAALTIPGLFARIRDAFAIVAGGAAEGLTGELLSTLSEIFTTLVDINKETGKIKPNPGVVKAFAGIFDGVKRVLVIVRSLGKSIGLRGLQTSTKIIGASLQIITSFLAGVIEGIQAVGSAFLTLVSPIIELLGGVDDATEAATRFVRVLGQVLITVVLIKNAMFLWEVAIKGATLAAGLFNISLGRSGAGLLGIVSKVGKLPLIFLAITQAVLSFTNAISGLDISLGDFGNVLFQGLKSTFEGTFRFAKFGFKTLANQVTSFFTLGQIKIFDLDAERKELDGFLTRARNTAIDIASEISGANDLFNLQIAESLEESSSAAALALSNLRKINELEGRSFKSADSKKRIEDLKKRNELLAETGAILGARQDPVDAKQFAAFKTQQAQATLAIEQQVQAEKLLLGQNLGATIDQQAVIAAEGKLAVLKRQLQVDKLANELKIEGLERDSNKLTSLKQQALAELTIAEVARRGRGETALTTVEIEKQELALVKLELIREANRATIQRDLDNESRKTRAIEVQVANQRALLAIEVVRGTREERQAAVTQGKISVLKDEQRSQTEVLASEEKRFIIALKQEKSLANQNTLRQQWSNISEQALANQELLSIELEKQEELLRRQKIITEGDFLAGLTEGIRQLQEELPTAATEGIEFIKSAITGLGEFISTTLIDAFDPTRGSDEIKRAFGALLRDLATQLLQSLAIKLITQLFSPAGGTIAADVAAGKSVPFSFFAGNTGGKMPRKSTMSHFNRARGLHEGGQPGRPAGLHHTDTVPIWAAEGEFMMRVAAVKKYGLALMESINRGLLDPSALDSMDAATGRTRVRRPTGPGFAHGGEIPGTQNTTTDLPIGGAEGGAPSVLPILPVTPSVMETFIAGGEAELLAFMRDNADEIAINQSGG